ncbi:MAG: hypothetical protein HN368_08215 [Spirochaetales bacterium]|jgi:hypothetical protein|nr:hypothetical protein [Spirochaetales bacterium]
MAKSKASLGSGALLQLATGLALFFNGLFGITVYNSKWNEVVRTLSRTFGGKSDTLDLIFSILLMASGALIAAALFLSVDTKILFLSTIVVFIIWAIRIVMVYIVDDIFEPDFLVWVTPLCIDLVVLASIWTITRKYA